MRMPSSWSKALVAGGLAVSVGTAGFTGLASVGAIVVAVIAAVVSVVIVVVHWREWHAWLLDLRVRGRLPVLLTTILLGLAFATSLALLIRPDKVASRQHGSEATPPSDRPSPEPTVTRQTELAPVPPQKSLTMTHIRAATPDTLAQPQPSAAGGQQFWPIVGCAFPEGIPTGPTGLSGASVEDLRHRVRRYSQKLREREAAFKASEKQALTLEPKPGEDALAVRQAALDAAKHGAIVDYQQQLKPEADVLVRELHVRLARPFPTSTADGLTVGAFGAVCGGLFYGRTPLSDLADWLTKLGNELK